MAQDDNIKYHHQIDSEEHNHRIKSKKVFSYWVFVIMTAYLLFVCIVVGIFLYHNPNSSTVMITLLTTTTANIIGLPWVTLRGIFNTDNK
jgi:hypothetical protein